MGPFLRAGRLYTLIPVAPALGTPRRKALQLGALSVVSFFFWELTTPNSNLKTRNTLHG